MDISIYKGGLSVPHRPVFINLKMTEEEILFYFGLAFFFSSVMICRISAKIRETEAGHCSPPAAPPEETAARVNRLFSYTAGLFDLCPCRNPAFLGFLLQNCMNSYSPLLQAAVHGSMKHI